MTLAHRLVLAGALVLLAVACVYAIPKDPGVPSAAGLTAKDPGVKPAGAAGLVAAPKAGDTAKPTTGPAKPKDPAAERTARAEAAKKAQEQARTRRTLTTGRTALSLEHTSVKDVLNMLSELGKFSVVYDPELETAGIDLTTRMVSLKFTGLKYEDALTLILPRECGYRIGPGYILVTTLEKSWLPLRTAIYSVHQALAEIPDFGGQAPRIEIATLTQQAASAVGGGGQGGGLFGGQQPAAGDKEGAVSPDRIIELIKKFVRHENDRQIAPWDDDGGPASITYLNGNLVISQTDRGHRAVAELMANLF